MLWNGWEVFEWTFRHTGSPLLFSEMFLKVYNLLLQRWSENTLFTTEMIHIFIYYFFSLPELSHREIKWPVSNRICVKAWPVKSLRLFSLQSRDHPSFPWHSLEDWNVHMARTFPCMGKKDLSYVSNVSL